MEHLRAARGNRMKKCAQSAGVRSKIRARSVWQVCEFAPRVARDRGQFCALFASKFARAFCKIRAPRAEHERKNARTRPARIKKVVCDRRGSRASLRRSWRAIAAKPVLKKYLFGLGYGV